MLTKIWNVTLGSSLVQICKLDYENLLSGIGISICKRVPRSSTYPLLETHSQQCKI